MYAYQTYLIVALTLIFGLVVYMYSICRDYLKQLISDEDNDTSAYGKAKFDVNTQMIVQRIKGS